MSTPSIIERPLVRPQLSGPSFLRASEPVSCWPHKPCEWRSTRQPATKFWGSRSTGGPLACNQQMRVQFPPLPPSSPGRPLRSRRRSEKPDKHVRLVLLAPSVTVAEWLRRQTVDLSTRVQFPPVTPSCAGVVQRRRHFGPNEEMPVRFRPPVLASCGLSSVGRERGRPKPEAAGSIPAAHTRSLTFGTRETD